MVSQQKIGEMTLRRFPDGASDIMGERSGYLNIDAEDRKALALALLDGLTGEMVNAAAKRLIAFDLYNGRGHWTDESLNAEAQEHARAVLESAFAVLLNNPFAVKD